MPGALCPENVTSLNLMTSGIKWKMSLSSSAKLLTNPRCCGWYGCLWLQFAWGLWGTGRAVGVEESGRERKGKKEREKKKHRLNCGWGWHVELQNENPPPDSHWRLNFTSLFEPEEKRHWLLCRWVYFTDRFAGSDVFAFLYYQWFHSCFGRQK